MKHTITLLTALIISACAVAQAPQAMTGQMVVRNSSGVLITNSNVGLRLSIHTATENGPTVSITTNTGTTNANGLLTYRIPEANVQQGDFTSIDWSLGPYFL